MAFVPSDLSSIIAHWRGEDIPSGTPDPLNWDDVVSSWRLSATGTAIPTYTASAINSLPALDFDDTNDVLITTTSKAMTGQPFAAIVFQLDAYSGNNGLYGHSTTAALPALGTNQRLAQRHAVNEIFMYPYNNSTLWRGKPSIVTATPSILVIGGGPMKMTCCLNGNLSYLYTGGGTGGTIAEQTESIYVCVGGTRSDFMHDGYISEVVLWNEPYEASHQSHVEGFLADKYAITLPTWHPFYSAAPSSGPSAGGGLLRHPGMSGGING